MRLAVVIPCYNHARYIEQAIRSVLGQTRPVDRLIIIDDGSTDDSVKVIRGMNVPLVELVEQENANAFNAINRGVAMAAEDCDAVAVLNSDDHYHPQRFQKLLPVLENDEAAAVVCSGLHLVDDDDRDLPDDHPRTQWFRAVWSLRHRDDLEMAEWMGLGNFPATTSNLLARADYMTANPMRAYHYNHDYFFLSGAAVRGALRIVDEPLVNYRVHAQNTMNTRTESLMKEILRQQIDFLRAFHGEMDADPEIRRRYKLYLRAAFDNVSAFHAGLLVHLLGRTLQDVDEDTTTSWVRHLDASRFPELNKFPNRHHVTRWPGEGALGTGTQLAEKLDAVRAERDKLRAERDGLRTLVKELADLQSSRSSAMGRLLGTVPATRNLKGRTAGEKLADLRRRLGKPA